MNPRVAHFDGDDCDVVIPPSPTSSSSSVSSTNRNRIKIPDNHHNHDRDMIIYTTNSNASSMQTNNQLLSCCFRSNNNYIQSVIIIIIISLILFVIIDTLTTQDVEQLLMNWIQLIEKHLFFGIIIIILVYIIATLCFIPGSVLTIGVGYAYSQAYPYSPALAIIFASIVRILCYLFFICILFSFFFCSKSYYGIFYTL